MNLLLDSHTLIWALSAPERLKPKARASIENGSNVVFYSTASIWEISIKFAKGLLELNERFLESLEEVGFRELPFRPYACRTGTSRTINPRNARPLSGSIWRGDSGC
jgi:PIN domain nuclease of toxin-antitoxin system